MTGQALLTRAVPLFFAATIAAVPLTFGWPIPLVAASFLLVWWLVGRDID